MDAATREFIERLGIRFEVQSLPRIAGRLLGLLLLTREALSLEEIADVLQVSKASASNNARLLERAGMLIRSSLPGDRRDYYRVGEDPEGRMLEQRIGQLGATREVMAAGLATRAADDPVIRERLLLAIDVLGGAMEALRSHAAKRRTRAEEDDNGGAEASQTG